MHHIIYGTISDMDHIICFNPSYRCVQNYKSCSDRYSDRMAFRHYILSNQIIWGTDWKITERFDHHRCKINSCFRTCRNGPVRLFDSLVKSFRGEKLSKTYIDFSLCSDPFGFQDCSSFSFRHKVLCLAWIRCRSHWMTSFRIFLWNIITWLGILVPKMLHGS